VVTHFLPHLNRDSVWRILKAEGLSRRLKPPSERPTKGQGTFRDYNLGFVHIDIKHLPKLRTSDGERRKRYLFVALTTGPAPSTWRSRMTRPRPVPSPFSTRLQPPSPSALPMPTGLKVYGAGEWLVEQHGARGRREWRKLHLAVDPDGGEILACELTSNEEGDTSQVSPLLAQIPGPISSVVADGAYDGEPVYRAVAERQSDPAVAVVIPPRSTAVPSTAAGTTPSQRDRHIALIQDKVRRGWQRTVGYGRRSLGETAMSRYKALIGRGLRARSRPAQETEARTA
jgi:DDE family transposase